MGGRDALILDLDLAPPLAFVAGYEWRLTAGLQLAVRQRTESVFSEILSDFDVATAQEPSRQSFPDQAGRLAFSCLDAWGGGGAGMPPRKAPASL